MASLPPEVARSVPRETIHVLQAGRALAALAVVAHHSEMAVSAFNGGIPGWLRAVLESGYLGVDFFFLLSGFIIFWSSEGKDLRGYAIGRARRIYIPYLPVGLAMALLYSVQPTAHQWDWLSSLTLFPVGTSPALTVAWTLQYELTFYAFFAILFFSGWLKIGLVLWSIAIAAAWALDVRNIMPLSILNFEFIFGILAAVAVRRGIHLPIWLAILPFLLWLLLGAQREHSVLVGLALMFVIASLAVTDLKGKLRTHPNLIFLGAASYSIYLVHNPAISVVARLTDSLTWWIALPLIFMVASAGGCLYHLGFEKPALRLKLRKRRTEVGHQSLADT